MIATPIASTAEPTITDDHDAGADRRSPDHANHHRFQKKLAPDEGSSVTDRPPNADLRRSLEN